MDYESEIKMYYYMTQCHMVLMDNCMLNSLMFDSKMGFKHSDVGLMFIEPHGIGL